MKNPVSISPKGPQYRLYWIKDLVNGLIDLKADLEFW